MEIDFYTNQLLQDMKARQSAKDIEYVWFECVSETGFCLPVMLLTVLWLSKSAS